MTKITKRWIIEEPKNTPVNPIVNGYTIMNALPETTAFAVGHIFFGMNGDEFVMGQVIALPFDINDKTKVKIHLNNI
ncbi:hypothetical protein [Aquimarina algiphila]|uniref:Uncharacterized protein n=1 Tax=Aquimarina algiphila TaxID=2047982 RepID=A0A554VE48_9FLAO|nr:hypothetical protein [Aquimarina algiphila]TSE05259.1 hypothetical protein FOF46_23640 [Aquimarina algiphila]